MANILATWIYLDTKESGSYFPSSKGHSSDFNIQKIYWRCVATFFATARYYNPDVQLALFSNVSEYPQVDGVDIAAELKKLNVTCYTTPFEYLTPEGYFQNWRNQFYEFSIFRFIANNPAFADSDNFILLDSDCIIRGDLQPVFADVAAKQCITYIMYYPEDYVIHGISRRNMQEVFERLSGRTVPEVPHYHAGEFYASTVAMLKTIINDFYQVWPKLLQYHAQGRTKLNEEAHVLSYLYHHNGISGGDADKYVKRLWTNGSSYRNVEPADADLLIWHLPAEKRYGFKQLFDRLKKKQFALSTNEAGTLDKELRHLFKVPNVPLKYQVYYFIRKSAKKLLKK